MADALLKYLRQTLPPEIATLTEPYIAKLEAGEYESILRDPQAQKLFGHEDDAKTAEVKLDDFPSWNDFIFHRLGVLLADRSKPQGQSVFFCIGYAAFLAFVQSNVTGPPLSFVSSDLLLPQDVSSDTRKTQDVRTVLLECLGMDGIAAYRLTPNVELLCLAEAIFTCPPILKYIKPARWAKLRLAFMQQRLLSEVSSSLQELIYEDIELLQEPLLGADSDSALDRDGRVEYLLERATIHIHHGFDKLAKDDLETAKRQRDFEFALTGLLGKRTKFQDRDVSQLVVLARSSSDSNDKHVSRDEVQITRTNGNNSTPTDSIRPANVDLEDDTLLDSITFATEQNHDPKIVDESALPTSLSSLDPSAQPQLQPLDSVILLTFASSITSTSPQDGLSREETLPYATRVLEGGSSNWQIHTQALLLRSRIEGYNPRTVERGLLQLQSLVDQIIANTSGTTNPTSDDQSARSSTTFLPKSQEAESAPAPDRLRYIFQLASPTRWSLEAELAARWVQLGGLRSALDIYERLEMWAEAALCWAGTDRDDKARNIIRRQLFSATANASGELDREVDDNETWDGPPRDPPPADAPRLYCILGDIDKSPEMYEKAWAVSGQRYARAQRSLGRYYFASRDWQKAADAYRKSLKANQLNHASWFALGCALLELADFDQAVEAFSRCVQLDENDAEAWSNLAAALLRKEPSRNVPQNRHHDSDDEAPINGKHKGTDPQASIQRNRRDALNALKRASSLRHDSYQIWENVLIVAASLSQPDYSSILTAQKRIIELRGPVDGEKCVDVGILEALVLHVMSLSDTYDPEQPGAQRMVVRFIDQSVVPLITGSAELWRIVSKLALWRNKPSSALDAEEKAWRVITSQPGWETESEKRWNEVVEATVRLCDSYESLGPRERTEGMGAGELVAKDWKFKARTAIRGILGRGKGNWEGTEGWDRLKDVADGLKG